jgi:hypothetical protein
MSDGTVDPVIERARRALRQEEPADAERVDALMRGVRARPLPRRAPTGWLRRRLDVSITPLAAAALLLVVAGVGGIAGVAAHRLDGAPRGEGAPVAGTVFQRTAAPATTGAPPSGDAVVLVHFAMVAPDARQVALVGDFNGWSPTVTPLRRAPASGAWWVEVPLRAGRYTYAFLLDGRLWVPDPAAPLAPEDGFGRRNSVVVVASAS